MLKIIIICLTLLLPASSFADDYADVKASIHSWGSKRMDVTLWGIVRGDLDGNGTKELVLMERDRIWLGRQEGDKLVESSTYRFPKSVEGYRIYATDVNGDGKDEVIISAFAYQAPASMILQFDGDGFKPLATNINWHLRVMERGGQKSLIGQRFTMDEPFAGKLYELEYDDGKIKRVKHLDLPRWANVYNFTFIPGTEGKEVLISIKGRSVIRTYEERGRKKRWKKFWTGNGRFGGTLSYVDLKTRPPLQDLPHYRIPIYHEPIALYLHNKPSFLAAKYDMPLHNIIGRKELITGGRLLAFSNVSAYGYAERFMTERLPGFIADYLVEKDPTGTSKLYVALQTDTEMFEPGLQSSVLIYDLASSPIP